MFRGVGTVCCIALSCLTDVLLCLDFLRRTRLKIVVLMCGGVSTVRSIALTCLTDVLLCLDFVWKNDFDFILVLLRASLRQDVQSAMQRYKA